MATEKEWKDKLDKASSLAAEASEFVRAVVAKHPELKGAYPKTEQAIGPALDKLDEAIQEIEEAASLAFTLDLNTSATETKHRAITAGAEAYLRSEQAAITPQMSVARAAAKLAIENYDSVLKDYYYNLSDEEKFRKNQLLKIVNSPVADSDSAPSWFDGKCALLDYECNLGPAPKQPSKMPMWPWLLAAAVIVGIAYAQTKKGK